MAIKQSDKIIAASSKKTTSSTNSKTIENRGGLAENLNESAAVRITDYFVQKRNIRN